jgi:hypothetical protein
LFIDGTLKELNEDTIDCDDKAINSFRFDAGEKRFNYKCATGAGGPVNSGHQEYTAWTRGADKGLNYLDRHFLKCPEHEFITHFDEEVKNNDIRFNYQCKKWSAYNYQCRDKSTEWTARGEDTTLIYLDRHNI